MPRLHWPLRLSRRLRRPPISAVPRGSIKDGGYQPAYAAPARGPAGPCYFRGDLGYSVSRDPTVKWAVTQQNGVFDTAGATAAGATGTYDPATNVYTPGAGDPVGFDPNAFYSIVNSYLGDSVTGTSMENAFFGGAGIGCGMGSRGLRGEFMLGYTGHRKIDGQPLIWNGPAGALGIAPSPIVNDDPLHTGVKSYTGMFNAYYDFGNWGGITPYLGAGVGVAYNKTSDVWFTDNVNLPNRTRRRQQPLARLVADGWYWLADHRSRRPRHRLPLHGLRQGPVRQYRQRWLRQPGSPHRRHDRPRDQGWSALSLRWRLLRSPGLRADEVSAARLL